MADQAIKLYVVAPTFLSVIHTTLCEHFKKLLKPDEIVIRSISDDAEAQNQRLIQALTQTNPTALIAMSIRPHADTIAAYRNAKVPIVLIDEETPELSTIAIDNFAAGKMAGEHLIKTGRKKIAIVSGRTKVDGGLNAELRLKGFLQAAANQGITVPPEFRIEVDHYSREDGLQTMPKLLNLGVDAVFSAAGDTTAIGLLSYARDHGVKVPETIAIMGFDDLFISQVSTPKLTTIRQPLKEMADAAFKMAVLRKSEILQKPEKAIFKPEIVIRQSA